MSTVLKGFKIRAYPNATQRALAARTLGAKRWLWNTALELRSAAYKELGLRLKGKDVSRMLTQWKKTPEHEWLAAVPATALTQTLRDLDRAFTNFFAKRAQYPRIKKRRHGGKLRFQDVSAAKWRKGQLALPKFGRLRLAERLPKSAKPKTMTLTCDAAGRYFVSFSVEVKIEDLPSTGKMIGVDLGLKHLATLSNGEKIAAPKKYAGRLRYLKRQQRALARKQAGSKRREKQRLRVAKAHVKVAQARNYEIHQLTTRLVRDYDVIAIEDLNVKGLSRGFLSRSMLDAAFGEFNRQLTYKAAWYGKQVVKVDRYFPSSKLCSACGHKLQELKLRVRSWRCPECGALHDRDENAAINIETEGLRILREPGNSTGVTPEPVRTEGRGSCRSESTGQVLPGEVRSAKLNTTASGTR
jgi:putative transposase